ncbi:sugar phosphate isomerase/epimerase family protein [Cohnella hashimotonis]|uniref:Sugar phosphate isomerase/epimerase family protein n=1 Tax=Cohnella hashimotonis TaxID=2826895 RepID=A0ABT6TAE9_9BACL|nr:sugar phosphate isomerase/epimerase family protein [Cohnella hashimotonis]MDI4643800.1 sugar phosphate isomerase/epimerase family protein [Cohnella hashimotonis]
MFPFKAALNASTLFPFELEVPEQIAVAARAGYEGIELWVPQIKSYLAGGGTIAALRSCLEESGLAFPNAIAFFRWADEVETEREAAFEQAEREMQLLSELGCGAVAAPPFGEVGRVSADELAARFARLVELGRSIGIEPYLEFWGRAPKLSRLDEARDILRRSGVSDGKLLLDPFHMYTGGSAIAELGALTGAEIGICHANDYPASPGVESIGDGDRVFPGEGIAPLHDAAKILHRVGYDGYLSLELFVADFGGLTADEAASKGLQAMREAFDVESGM